MERPTVGFYFATEKKPLSCVSCCAGFFFSCCSKQGCKENILFPVCYPYGCACDIVEPCVCASMGNLFTLLTCDQVCCGCCKHGKCDPVFPPLGSSIGCLKAAACHPYLPCTIPCVLCCCSSWAPADKVAEAAGLIKSGEKMELFKDGISPQDIGQGAVGDCWLLASFAAAAEQPLIIQHCFLEKEFQPSGLYHVRLFDGPSQSWRTIAVDHRLPKLQGNYLSTAPNGGELWVGLLEKAVAKMRGSYHAMEGGFASFGFEMLTGQPSAMYRRIASNDKKTHHWDEYRSAHYASGSRGSNTLIPTGFILPDECNSAGVPSGLCTGLWSRLLYWEKNNYLMSAGTPQDANKGIVPGHAYSLLAAYECGGIKLVKLRNPWGKGEWTGEWSDGDAQWDSHPDMKEKCGYDGTKKDDGIFFMSFADFIIQYNHLDVINPKVDTLPSNNQMAGNIGAACSDQCFTMKRCGLDTFRFFCCCAGFFQHNKFLGIATASCFLPCMGSCWENQFVFATPHDKKGNYKAVETKNDSSGTSGVVVEMKDADKKE